MNYVNYFTEIENYFQCKRDVFTLLTTLDWVLIENWKEQGIPLETVFKGIDRAFERPNARRRIGSLAYCVKAVEQVRDELKDLKVDKPEMPEVSDDEVSSFIAKLAMAVSGLSKVFPEFAGKLEGIAGSIRQLDVSNLRSAEQTLTALEEKLIALIKVACEDPILLEVKQDVDRDLNPFRSTMTTEQLAMLEQQMWRRKLMERFDLPRLSLFYLM